MPRLRPLKPESAIHGPAIATEGGIRHPCQLDEGRKSCAVGAEEIRRNGGRQRQFRADFCADAGRCWPGKLFSVI